MDERLAKQRAEMRRQYEEANKKAREEAEAGERQAQKEKEDRAWLKEIEGRIEILLRIRARVKAIEATIEKLEQVDRETVEKEGKAREQARHGVSGRANDMEEEEKRQSQRHQERIQERTSQSIRLSWSKNELTQSEREHGEFLGSQSEERRRWAAKIEAKLKASMEEAREHEVEQQRAKEQEVAKKLAREKDTKRSEAKSRWSEVVQGVPEQNVGPTKNQKPESRRYQPLYKTGSSTPGHDPAMSNWGSGGQSRAAGNDDKCLHASTWLTVQGKHQCRKCSRSCNAYIFRCPDCDLLACGSCSAQLRPAA